MTRLKHYDDLGTARFITFSCHKRLPILSARKAAKTVIEQISIARKEFGFKLFGYVVMPEHVHLVIYPSSPLPIGRVIGEIKRKSGFIISRYLQDINSVFLRNLTSSKENRSQYVIWLPRCYDHNCRTHESVIEKIKYCHYNPVKGGLVGSPEEWPWSSNRHYQGIVPSPIEVDDLMI